MEALYLTPLPGFFLRCGRAANALVFLNGKQYYYHWFPVILWWDKPFDSGANGCVWSFYIFTRWQVFKIGSLGFRILLNDMAAHFRASMSKR